MAVELKVPPLGESITEAVVGKWNKKMGDAVSADEPLVVLETDKVTIDVPAPTAGSLSSISFKEGDKVRVGEVLGLIEAGAGAAAAKPAAAAAAPAPVQAPAPAAAPAAGDTRATPTARKVAEENQVDLTGVKGSGAGGRITKEDVLGQINRPAAPAQAPAAVPAVPSGPRPNAAREERVRMTPLRKRVAERLIQAQSTAAMLTTFNEVDMGEVMALRKKYNEKFQSKHGVKLGFMSFFIRASVEALKAFPQINAEIDGEDVIFKHYYDIGVAVSGSRGLVVPVVRNADKLGLADLEKTVGDYGTRARNDKLGLADLQGGTFTITNGGIFGSMLSTPILNPPQTGILGMHNIVERPVVRDGQIVIRPIMYVALTYDHRLVDGREAVQFLVRVKECIEDPERLLLEV
ncbi:2-oxoglutarate dehydrogenase complex dihydrolipoyllysine-residue succinyltransferase [Pyxidicoccus parkwayensis]|uniref:Dihydrolipoyllysine-residue succinyltransferase component of 2-oxoglutarate dehydrogenase complex n=1 Tax=Pyxidicoccus parkwayensis TaxID=2813578 RepID=A0ABX7P107_9BACT|nr:2-oxoglutarate dehydrogenase complex dihydrolipoyllysine-residue succinyltransferase [Pyxidicoccus parkwaysis]QSQ23467.1 2-oxoglutarate dehydrogenase complex dihydrolipoyllysine-residue succinyltransferase [Pyxidicoccus parkwaysis]